jgi:RNase P/RNase MRP subunit POP5
VRSFDPKARYRAGEILSHPEFGRGKVETVLRSSLLVRFSVGGMKSLMLV